MNALLLLFTLQRAATAMEPDSLKQCTVNLNTETVYEFEIPAVVYQRVVLPALQQVYQQHTRNYRNYVIPLPLFWDISGLSYLFDGHLPMTCCPLCPDRLCSEGFRATKLNPAYGPRTLDSLSMLPPGTPVPVFTNRKDRLDATLTLPRLITAEGGVLGSSFHLVFHSDRAPTLRLVDEDFEGTGRAQVIFDDHVRCVGTVSDWAVIRPWRPSNNPLSIPLVFRAK
jgi:hypothetical protein